jgi:hypothetical protein
MRWTQAAALLLLVGSVAGSLLLGRDASPARQTEATQAATRGDATGAAIEAEGANVPPRTTPTETPQAPAPPNAPAPPDARRPAPAAAARRTGLPRIPIQRGSTLPMKLYMKETQR